MGFDMYLVERIATNDEALEAARAEINAAVAARDGLERGAPESAAAQQRVMEAFDKKDRLELNYFRLNIFGMSSMSESLEKLGMLAWHYPRSTEWPEAKDFGLTDEEVSELDVDEREDYTGSARDYLDAIERVLSWSPPDEPGLPVHKFGSNDGWHVTALDCKGALEIFKKADPELVVEVRAEWLQDDGSCYFDDWIAFLERGAAGDGFKVW